LIMLENELMNQRPLIRLAPVCAFVVFLVAALAPGRAATITWTNTASGGWNTAANWDPNTVPGASDAAIITNAGVTVSLNGATTVGAIVLGTNGVGTVTLSLAGQSLALNGPLTVNPSGSFTVDSGALVGSTNAVLSGNLGWSAANLGGKLTLASGSTLNLTSGNYHDMQNCTLTNHGTVVWNSGTIRSGGGSPGTIIYNYGLWDAQSDQVLNGAVFGGSGTEFNNYGTFRKSGGASEFDNATILVGTVFNQLAGVLDVQNGTNGLEVAFQGGGNFTGGYITTNVNGLTVLSSGSFNLNGSVTGTNTWQDIGSLVGTNVINGALTWVGGTWNSAVITIASNSTVIVDGGSGVNDMANCTLTNNGTVAWNSGTIRSGGGSPGTFIYNYGLWDAQSDQQLNAALGGSAVFNNIGTFRKSGGINPAINTLFAGGVLFNQASGVLVVDMGNVVLQGGGNFTGGYVTTNSTGTTYLSLGNFNINGTAIASNVVENAGNLVGNNFIDGTLTWVAGNWNGAVVTIASNSIVTIAGGGGANDLPNCTVTNNGTVAWASGQIRGGSTSGTSIYNYGLWDAQCDQQLNAAFGGVGAVFNNFGTFRKELTSGTTAIAGGVTFNNTGKLDAQDGNIALQGAYTLANGTQMGFGLGGSTGNGSISLSAAASFAGSVSVNLNGFFWPAAGSSFNLLNYTSESGLLFTNTTLPPAGYISWQTNYNAAAFAISVIAHTATNTVSTNLYVSRLDGANIILQWPGDHTGWTIQAQTNPPTAGLSTNWSTLAGSSLTNQFVMPIDETNGSFFFRMVYP
jgi:hypothetical protein